MKFTHVSGNGTSREAVSNKKSQVVNESFLVLPRPVLFSGNHHQCPYHHGLRDSKQASSHLFILGDLPLVLFSSSILFLLLIFREVYLSRFFSWSIYALGLLQIVSAAISLYIYYITQVPLFLLSCYRLSRVCEILLWFTG